MFILSLPDHEVALELSDDVIMLMIFVNFGLFWEIRHIITGVDAIYEMS